MFSKPKMKKDSIGDTPKTSSGTRTGWMPLVCEKEGRYQVRIACQRSSGIRDLYSSAPSATKRRPAWAPATDCEFVSEKTGAESQQFFAFVNMDDEKKSFSSEKLNPFIYSCNPFTQKCTSLIVEKKSKLLGYYIDLTCKSAGFCSQKQGYDDTGFTTDGSLLCLKDLEDAGGSLDELKLFQSLARENAFKFGTTGTAGAGDQNFRLSSLNKRKITDHFNPDPKKKQTKTERVESNFREFIEQENGMEKLLVNSYVNFRHIKLDNLSVSPKLFLPVNDANVREIMDSMEEQFEPASSVLTVCPVDMEAYNSGINFNDQHFYVMCGQHRLLAMKSLSSQGKFEKCCKGLFQGNKVPCYVCKTDSLAVTNHANIRSNDTSSKFKNTASNEDLIFVFAGLVKASVDHTEATDIVKKLCISRRTAPEDISAMMKILEWPEDNLEKLIRVLESFKRFSTLDAMGYGTKSSLKDRKQKKLTKEKFRQLGCCKPEYFAEHYEGVLSNKLSLADLLKESADHNALERTVGMIGNYGGLDDIKNLKQIYPSKFDDETLKRYKGAEPYGKKKNRQGDMLKNYIKSVKEGREVKDPIVLEEIRSVFDVDANKLNNFDVLVYNNPKTWQPDYIKCLIDFAGTCIKDHFAVFIIFSLESQLQQVIKALDFWREDKPEFMVSQILFEKRVGHAQTGSVQENLTFGVLFGKVNLFKGHMVSYQKGPVESELNKVVDKVCAPSAKVAYITGGDSKMIRVHPTPPEIVDKEVTYFASKNGLDRFRKKFLIDVLVESKEQGSYFPNAGTNDDVVRKEAVNDASVAGVRTSQEGTDDEIDIATDRSASADSSEEESTEEDISKLDGDQRLEKQPSTSSKQYKCSPNDADFE